MKVKILFIVVCASFIFNGTLSAETLMVADFESGSQPNNVGGDFGTWEINPEDETQGCDMGFALLDDVMGRASCVLKIDYDIASAAPAFNGIWMKLNNIDLTQYDELSMLIKGDEEAGFTTQFKMELKNAKGQRAIYKIKGITKDWQRVVVPMEKFRMIDSINDWSRMTELVFVFDDLTVSYKQGTLYVDDIAFTSKGAVY